MLNSEQECVRDLRPNRLPDKRAPLCALCKSRIGLVNMSALAHPLAISTNLGVSQKTSLIHFFFGDQRGSLASSSQEAEEELAPPNGEENMWPEAGGENGHQSSTAARLPADFAAAAVPLQG